MILKYICICSSVYSLVLKKKQKKNQKKNYILFSVTILTVWVAGVTVNTTSTAPRCVAPALQSKNRRGGSYMKLRHKMSSKCQIRRKWRVKCSYIWTPSSLFSDPADFCPAHDTADPVTAIFLLDDDPTLWAFHGFAIL